MSTSTDPFPDFSGLTFEKIWALFQESHKESERISAQMKETDQMFKEIIKETGLQMRETDRKLQETENIVERNERQLEKLEKQVAETNQQMGRLGNRFGEVIEHLVLPGVVARFNELGFHFDGETCGFKVKNRETGKTLTELDIVLENGESIVIVETKVEPSYSDIEHFFTQLQHYKNYKKRSYPNDNKKIYGAIAGAVFPEQVQSAVIEAGLYAIVQSGDTMTIAVPEGFVHKVF